MSSRVVLLHAHVYTHARTFASVITESRLRRTCHRQRSCVFQERESFRVLHASLCKRARGLLSNVNECVMLSSADRENVRLNICTLTNGKYVVLPTEEAACAWQNNVFPLTLFCRDHDGRALRRDQRIAAYVVLPTKLDDFW